MSAAHQALDNELAAAVAAGQLLGLSLALIEHGELTFAQGYGHTAADETGVAVDAATLFAYGSISKVICAALVGRLLQQGLLHLDRPLVDYLPHLAFSDSAFGGRLTLRHVLSHTTGLPAAGRDYGPRGAAALQQLLEAELPHYAFVAVPGTLHLYANTVYCLAGYAAEIVTGRDYDSLVQELVLDPLGMSAITFAAPSGGRVRLALPHESDEHGLRPITRLPANDAGHPSGFAYGTATDLARLALTLMDGADSRGKRLLTRQTLQELNREHTSRYVTGAAHPLAHISAGYGLGIMTGAYKGHRVLRHGGMMLSYNCFFELLPQQRSGFVLLTNAAEEGPLMELVALLYDRLLGVPSRRAIQPLDAPPSFHSAAEKARWPHYEGLYLNVEWGGLVAVRAEQQRLLLQQDGAELPLTCIAPGRYYAPTGSGTRLPLAFLGGAAGRAPHIVLAGQPYHRHTMEQAPAGAAQWGVFAGRYRDRFNANEQELLHLQLEENRLLIREAGGEWLACEPLGARAFRCDLGYFELATDEAGAAPLLLWGKATRYHYLGAEA